MATLDDVVNVQIALQTTGVVRGNFGTPLIAGALMSFPERVRTYQTLQAAQADGLPTKTLTAITDCFSQIPRPRYCKVGRRTTLSGEIVVNTVRNLALYSFTVGAMAYDYTSSAAATASEIVLGLKAAVDADPGAVITATAVGDVLVVAYIGAALNAIILTTTNLIWGTMVSDDSATTISADLTAMVAEDPDWYGLVLVDRQDDSIYAAAEWTEANERLFITATDSNDCLDVTNTTDIISRLKAARFFRTAIIWTEKKEEYPDAAWAGRVFTIQPGAETWALKGLASVSPSKISATQANTIKVKGGNTFEFYQEQVALTNPGKVAAGEWIDVIRFRDWLKDVIQTNMVMMMINRDKVPYTDQGIQLCVNSLRKSLQEGVISGGIAPDELDSNGDSVPGFQITWPRSVEVPANIKASRILYLAFRARLAGAIHVVEIAGALAYEL